MPIQFFKPNQKNTGNACSFSVNSKEGAVYANFIHQTGPQQFKGGKSCNVKFSMYEVGSLIDTIEKGRKTNSFHKFPNGTQIVTYNFEPYYIGEGDDKKFRGYGLSITQSDAEDSSVPKEKFSIGFTPGEAVTLREYFRWCLSHINDAIYSADKKAREANAKPAADAKKKETPKPKKKEEPADGEDPFADDPFTESSTVLDGPTEISEMPEATPDSAQEVPKKEKVDKVEETQENSHQQDDDIF